MILLLWFHSLWILFISMTYFIFKATFSKKPLQSPWPHIGVDGFCHCWYHGLHCPYSYAPGQYVPNCTVWWASDHCPIRLADSWEKQVCHLDWILAMSCMMPSVCMFISWTTFLIILRGSFWVHSLSPMACMKWSPMTCKWTELEVRAGRFNLNPRSTTD